MLPNEDVDVSKVIAKEYKKLGVKVLTSTGVQTVTDNGDSVTVTYKDKGGQRRFAHRRQGAHVGRFRAPRRRFGLERTGCSLTERGAIAIDDYMRTNVDGIYAIGDVTAKLQLAHVAEAQGVVAAETMAGAETMTSVTTGSCRVPRSASRRSPRSV